MQRQPKAQWSGFRDGCGLFARYNASRAISEISAGCLQDAMHREKMQRQLKAIAKTQCAMRDTLHAFMRARSKAYCSITACSKVEAEAEETASNAGQAGAGLTCCELIDDDCLLSILQRVHPIDPACGADLVEPLATLSACVRMQCCQTTSTASRKPSCAFNCQKMQNAVIEVAGVILTQCCLL